jgi:hypothetical protein
LADGIRRRGLAAVAAGQQDGQDDGKTTHGAAMTTDPP